MVDVTVPRILQIDSDTTVAHPLPEVIPDNGVSSLVIGRRDQQIRITRLRCHSPRFTHLSFFALCALSFQRAAAAFFATSERLVPWKE
jgi:hypothetical protein